MTRNFRFIIEYDGTDFSGWQIQKNGRTIQGEIETALQTVFNNSTIKLTGSGRTDSGVHAMAQVAHVFLDTDFSPGKVLNALNGNIRKDIWIKNCEEVNSDFHARYSARIREYRYFISRDYSPLMKDRQWYLARDLDINLLKECANRVMGEHDFSSFCKATAEVKNKICQVFDCVWNMDKPQLNLVIRANRYLQHMVRYLAGTMTEVARGRYTIEQFSGLLNGEDGEIQVFRAPAHGLYLWSVDYE